MASAYDSVPAVSADFEAMEKKRLARQAMEKKNLERIKPLLAKVSSAQTAQEFSDASDELAVWIIGEGSLPPGIDAEEVRDTIQDAYEALPKVKYACEPTRTNNGVCSSPGPIADPAYKAVINELRKAATRKGKGSLMSDGVSAANSAAF